MNSNTVRRQVWLTVILAGLALLWWRSSVTDRYADLSGYGVAQRPLRPPPGLGSEDLARELQSPATWFYTTEADSSGIVVRWLTSQGKTSITVITVDSGRVNRRVLAELEGGYYPTWMNVQDVKGGVTYQLEISTDSIFVQLDGDAGLRLAYPYPYGALFEDLVLVQAMAWKGLEDSATVQVIALSGVGIPLRVFGVTLHDDAPGDLRMSASPAQSAILHFADDSPRVTSYCTTSGECFEAGRNPIWERGRLIDAIDPIPGMETP